VGAVLFTAGGSVFMLRGEGGKCDWSTPLFSRNVAAQDAL